MHPVFHRVDSRTEVDVVVCAIDGALLVLLGLEPCMSRSPRICSEQLEQLRPPLSLSWDVHMQHPILLEFPTELV